jgi:hypothetical protein
LSSQKIEYPRSTRSPSQNAKGLIPVQEYQAVFGEVPDFEEGLFVILGEDHDTGIFTNVNPTYVLCSCDDLPVNFRADWHLTGSWLISEKTCFIGLDTKSPQLQKRFPIEKVGTTENPVIIYWTASSIRKRSWCC